MLLGAGSRVITNTGLPASKVILWSIRTVSVPAGETLVINVTWQFTEKENRWRVEARPPLGFSASCRAFNLFLPINVSFVPVEVRCVNKTGRSWLGNVLDLALCAPRVGRPSDPT